MGNSACCEEEAKAGDFSQVKPKFQPNKIHIQPHKVATVDFNAQPANVKTVFLEPRPGGRKEGHKEERNRQAESQEDQLPIISSNIESRYREGSPSSHLLNARPHRQEEPEQEEQAQIELEQSQRAEEGERAEIQLQEQHKHEAEKVELLAPKLAQPVEATLHAERFFHGQFPSSPHYKRYDNEFYEGQLDETGRFPEGLGRLYKQDHSLYVGHFAKGKAEGQGAFVFPDGSFYFGEFRDNFAEGRGSYKSRAFSYEGEFKRNRFHGKGKEVGAAHEFTGEYYAGSKTYGRLGWKERGEEYEYFGSFTNGQFNGEGTLKEPTGTYKGEFINGKKHGYGVYHFANGLRFEGEYREGVRQGKGALYNPNNRLAYEGEFQAGMPHGEGSILDPTGKKLKTKWVEGIDSTYL